MESLYCSSEGEIDSLDDEDEDEEDEDQDSRPMQEVTKLLGTFLLSIASQLTFADEGTQAAQNLMNLMKATMESYLAAIYCIRTENETYRREIFALDFINNRLMSCLEGCKNGTLEVPLVANKGRAEDGEEKSREAKNVDVDEGTSTENQSDQMKKIRELQTRALENAKENAGGSAFANLGGSLATTISTNTNANTTNNKDNTLITNTTTNATITNTSTTTNTTTNTNTATTTTTTNTNPNFT